MWILSKWIDTLKLKSFFVSQIKGKGNAIQAEMPFGWVQFNVARWYDVEILSVGNKT